MREGHDIDDNVIAIKGERYLYVLQYSEGDLVRVGTTNDPRRRRGEHSLNIRPSGLEVTDYWYSRPHLDWSVTEKTLHQRCRAAAGLGPRMKLSHYPLPFVQVRAWAQEIVASARAAADLPDYVTVSREEYAELLGYRDEVRRPSFFRALRVANG